MRPVVRAMSRGLTPGPTPGPDTRARHPGPALHPHLDRGRRPTPGGRRLCPDWSTSRTPTWGIDTALPHLAALNQGDLPGLPADQQARLAALLQSMAIAANAIVGIRLPDRAATLGQAETALAKAGQARGDL